jgi:hypothetical protein
MYALSRALDVGKTGAAFRTTCFHINRLRGKIFPQGRRGNVMCITFQLRIACRGVVARTATKTGGFRIGDWPAIGQRSRTAAGRGRGNVTGIPSKTEPRFAFFLMDSRARSRPVILRLTKPFKMCKLYIMYKIYNPFRRSL